MTTQQQVPVDRTKMRAAYRKGLWGAFWLAVLTLGEFAVFAVGDGTTWGSLALIPFIFLKAWIILDVFMHIKALWSPDH